MSEVIVAFGVPFVVSVVLPVSIVFIVSLYSQRKYDKKFSFLEKCVENGVEINPELFMDQKQKPIDSKAVLKTMLLNRLASGIVFFLMGSGLLAWSVIPHVKNVALLMAIASLAVGIGLLVWYFIGKKMLAEELEEKKEQEQKW